MVLLCLWCRVKGNMLEGLSNTAWSAVNVKSQLVYSLSYLKPNIFSHISRPHNFKAGENNYYIKTSNLSLSFPTPLPRNLVSGPSR